MMFSGECYTAVFIKAIHELQNREDLSSAKITFVIMAAIRGLVLVTIDHLSM